MRERQNEPYADRFSPHGRSGLAKLGDSNTAQRPAAVARGSRVRSNQERHQKLQQLRCGWARYQHLSYPHEQGHVLGLRLPWARREELPAAVTVTRSISSPCIRARKRTIVERSLLRTDSSAALGKSFFHPLQRLPSTGVENRGGGTVALVPPQQKTAIIDGN